MRCGKISSGVWLCLALGVFAAAVPLAFYGYARSVTNATHSTVPIGVPSRSLRVISLNLHRDTEISERQLSAIRSFDPDYLFLQEIHGKSLADLQRRLGGIFTASAYYPLQNRPDSDTDVGVAILSKFPLEVSRPIPNHMNGACGVWAASEVEGRRFYVACLKLSESGDSKAEMENFKEAWASLGKPPIIAAVDAMENKSLPWESDSIGFHSTEWMGVNVGNKGGLHSSDLSKKPL